MKKARVGLWLLLAASLAGASGCGRSGGLDRSREEASLRALDAQWSATAAKNDVAETVAFYADDAVLLPPNAPMATNPQAIRASWAGMLGPNMAVSWKVTKGEIAQSGELGYLYGTYALDVRDAKSGATTHDTGKFVEIWKKQANGQWKCIVDTYNSDLPVAAGKEAS